MQRVCVQADANRLSQVLRSLLTYAVKVAPRGSAVLVTGRLVRTAVVASPSSSVNSSTGGDRANLASLRAPARVATEENGGVRVEIGISGFTLSDVSAFILEQWHT